MGLATRDSRKKPEFRFWVPFVVIGLVAVFCAVPMIPCGSTNCVAVYRERMRVSRLPGLPQAQAAALRSYAWSDTCGRCSWGARRSLLQWILRDGVELALDLILGRSNRC